MQNSYYRELSAACNNKINPAFAWVYHNAHACHLGVKFLNTVPSLDSAIKRESTNALGTQIPGSILQKLHSVQVKHLVWCPGNTNSPTIWGSLDPQNNLWESLDLCKVFSFQTAGHLDLAEQLDSTSNQRRTDTRSKHITPSHEQPSAGTHHRHEASLTSLDCINNI